MRSEHSNFVLFTQSQPSRASFQINKHRDFVAIVKGEWTSVIELIHFVAGSLLLDSELVSVIMTKMQLKMALNTQIKAIQ